MRALLLTILLALTLPGPAFADGTGNGDCNDALKDHISSPDHIHFEWLLSEPAVAARPIELKAEPVQRLVTMLAPYVPAIPDMRVMATQMIYSRINAENPIAQRLVFEGSSEDFARSLLRQLSIDGAVTRRDRGGNPLLFDWIHAAIHVRLSGEGWRNMFSTGEREELAFLLASPAAAKYPLNFEDPIIKRIVFILADVAPVSFFDRRMAITAGYGSEFLAELMSLKSTNQQFARDLLYQLARAGKLGSTPGQINPLTKVFGN